MKPLNVALVWHMHQPDYRDPVSGRTLLPWTWLHAVKDYGEMLRIAREIPGVRLTFNLVPTLVEQLDEYVAGRVVDDWLEAARKDPETMTEEERRFLIADFFSVYPERHIRPHARYLQLARLRGDEGDAAVVGRFSPQDLRDLQVWFLLSWAGHCLRRDSAKVRSLLDKGRFFSEEDKTALLKIYDAVAAAVVDSYRDAERRGDIELSFTPYAHPILPLLCDTSVALQARRESLLPQSAFRHPEDARLQVRYGRELMERRFDRRPRGMWPAEGAVSQAALRLLREEGVLWSASDEGILAKSLPGGLSDRRLLYRPYSFAGLPLLFRDRELSDRIGFVYAHWETRQAVEDFLGRLRHIARNNPGGVLTLILDGENCWERYPDNGYPFLSAFYQGLLEDPALRMVTVSEALAERQAVPLPQLAPGSWINGDFDVWIGGAQENTAWEWLVRVRSDLPADPPAGDDSSLPDAWLHLLRAEGSDWFWWFGDHHRTDQADVFDRLFRHNLQALYHDAGRPVPDQFYRPIKEPRQEQRIREPAALFTPEIDGRVTDYFEWLAAGTVELSAGGAMHEGDRELTAFCYGYDSDYFYLRIDFRRPLEILAGPDGWLELQFSAGRQSLVRFQPAGDLLIMQRPDGSPVEKPGRAASGSIFELALALDALQLEKAGMIGLSLRLLVGGGEMARWPLEGDLQLCYRGIALEEIQWPV
jgi:alpha-amylase/alpha-mannosidase (GH57 family)